jgi:hypothetical protein
MGPAGIGKSSTLAIVEELSSDFGRTGSIVTRQPEARDDPRFIRYVNLAESLQCIQEHTFVNYVVHPTTSTIYSTALDMFSSRYNMLEALPESIAYFWNVGFKKVYVFYLATEPRAWQTWFDERYPNRSSTERKKRLAEAKTSLNWALADHAYAITHIYNSPGGQHETAQKIIDSVKYNKKAAANGREYVRAMLQQIEEMK